MDMPANCGPSESLRFLIREQQAELERFSEADVVKFGRR
jgi:hypothetical protein